MKKVMGILVCIGLLAPVFCFGEEIEITIDEKTEITELLKFVVIGIKDPEYLLSKKQNPDMKAFKDGDNIDKDRDIWIHFIEGYIAEYKILNREDREIYTFEKTSCSEVTPTTESTPTPEVASTPESPPTPESPSTPEAPPIPEDQPTPESPSTPDSSTENENSSNNGDSENQGAKDSPKSLDEVKIKIPIGELKGKCNYGVVKEIYRGKMEIDKRQLEDGYKLVCTIYKKDEASGEKKYIGSRTFNIVDSGLKYLTIDNISIAPIFVVNIGKEGPSEGLVKATDFALGVNYMFFVTSEKYKHLSNLLFGLNASVSHTELFNENTQETEMTTVVNWAGTLGYKLGNLLLQFVVGMGNATGKDKYLQIGFGIGKIL